MNEYLRTIYQGYPKSGYPAKLAAHLVKKYFSKSKAKILDVCCGDGEYCRLFSLKGLETHAIDKEQSTHKLWQENCYKKCDFTHEQIPFPDNTFDYVFTKSAIEHFSDTDRFLREIRRVLKPNGVVVILTPAWEYNYKDFFNDYTHIRPFHRKGLQDALRINGFRENNVRYFYHLPFMWKFPILLPFVKFISLFSGLKWKDKEETVHRPFIRFCQEVQLIAVAKK